MQDVHALFHSIHQLSRQLTKYKNEVLQPYGLFSAQWSVLYTLKIKGAQTQSEIGEYLSVEAPHITRTIKKLVELGYVTQLQGDDKRMKHVQLTDKALEEFPKWEEAVLRVDESLLKKLPESSQKELFSLISTWLFQL